MFKPQIIINKHSERAQYGNKILTQLGAVREFDELEGEYLYFIEINKIEELFKITEKLKEITDEYWLTIVDNYDEDKPIIYLEREYNS